MPEVKCTNKNKSYCKTDLVSKIRRFCNFFELTLFICLHRYSYDIHLVDSSYSI